MKLITETIKDNSVDKKRVKEKEGHTNTAIDVNMTTKQEQVHSKLHSVPAQRKRTRQRKRQIRK